ncbi:MAG: hypothetical protein RLZZ299_1742 [Pseudomonadota bacterium]|jgi:hypothetical protein
MLLLLASLAHADDVACTACCQAGGVATCATEIVIRGPGSDTRHGAGGWTTRGGWRLACGAPGRYDDAFLAATRDQPRVGEVLGPLSPLAAHCYAQACPLPPGLCLRSEMDGRQGVVGCVDGSPPTAETLAVSPAVTMQRAVVVVVEGHPLVVDASPLPDAVEAGEVGPDRAAPSVDALASAALADLTRTFPADPATPCVAPGIEAQAEARRHVHAGEGREAARDAAGALTAYRVALTLDACVAGGWLGLARVAEQHGRPDLAVHAADNALRLEPRSESARALRTRLGAAR